MTEKREMKKGKYELILFDADGTLFDYEKTEEWALEESFREAGLVYEPHRHLPAYRDINRRLWEDFERGDIAASELRIRRFRDLFIHAEIDADPAPLARLYVANLAKTAFLFDEAVPLLESLRPRFKLGIVTNGLKEVQRARFARTPVERYMDCIVVSDEIGVQKPEPGIFAYALRAAGHEDKSTTLVVGDSLTSDIQGGIAFGIDTCWFNPEGKTASGEIVPTYRIRRLRDLHDIL